MTVADLRRTGRRSHLAVVGDSAPIKSDSSDKTPSSLNLISCWGSSGSPGKSTIATNLASELALLGQRVLLIDLDTLSPSLAIALGLVDTPAGLSACLRLAEQGRLTREEYERLTVSIELGRNELRFMPGLNSPARWPEVTLERVLAMLECISDQVDHVVLDLPNATQFKSSFTHPSTMSSSKSLGRDELLVELLETSSKLVVVSGSDPVSAHRFLFALEYLKEAKPKSNPYVVVNRFRDAALGAGARAELEDTYLSLGKIRIDAFIPDEPMSFDRAMLNGLPLALLKRSSAARSAIANLARQLLLDSTSSDVLAKLS